MSVFAELNPPGRVGHDCLVEHLPNRSESTTESRNAEQVDAGNAGLRFDFMGVLLVPACLISIVMHPSHFGFEHPVEEVRRDLGHDGVSKGFKAV